MFSEDHFGVDNAPAVSAITSPTPAPPYGPGGNLSVSGTASDATSGLGSPGVTVTLRSGSPSGSVLFTQTNNASGGTWSVNFSTPPTTPGTYCVVSVANNIPAQCSVSVGASQCWTIAAADSTPPVVVLTLPAIPSGQAGFFNGSQVPVTGTVSATDPSGVAAITCTDSASGITLGPRTRARERSRLPATGRTAFHHQPPTASVTPGQRADPPTPRR